MTETQEKDYEEIRQHVDLLMEGVDTQKNYIYHMNKDNPELRGFLASEIDPNEYLINFVLNPKLKQELSLKPRPKQESTMLLVQKKIEKILQEKTGNPDLEVNLQNDGAFSKEAIAYSTGNPHTQKDVYHLLTQTAKEEIKTPTLRRA